MIAWNQKSSFFDFLYINDNSISKEIMWDANSGNVDGLKHILFMIQHEKGLGRA